MINKINKLLKGNVVFIGGVAEVIHGIRYNYNDIDIVCPDPSPLLEIAPMSVYSNSVGKWAKIIPSEGKNIDIWIKPLVEHVEINGVKYATLDEMIAYYNDLLAKDIEDKEEIKTKLKRLKR